MCTAITYKTLDNYFGRNLDLSYSYNETVTVTPRKYRFDFRFDGSVKEHYAMIGMAYVADEYPLYYDATNEKGLSIAGLNFPGNAVYAPYKDGMINVSPFELIPWLLCKCATVAEVKKLLSNVNLVNEDFSCKLKLHPLHWIIADRESSITLESVDEGIKIYENPVGVLTNNPGFEMQMFNLNNYLNLTSKVPENRFSPKLELQKYCQGLGAVGMPGDLSSMSRFVRAVFTKLNSVCDGGEEESVSQFFHILGAVSQQKGCVDLGDGEYEITVYSSCCNTNKGIYYYKTYNNSCISGVDMFRENLDGDRLISYNLLKGQKIVMHN